MRVELSANDVRFPFLIQSPNIMPCALGPMTGHRRHILGIVEKGLGFLVGHLRPLPEPPGFLPGELLEEVGVEVVVDIGGRVADSVWVDVGKGCSLSLSPSPSLLYRSLAGNASHSVNRGGDAKEGSKETGQSISKFDGEGKSGRGERPQRQPFI